MSLRECGERCARVRTDEAFGSGPRTEARRDAIDLYIVELDGPKELVQHWMPLYIAPEAALVPATKQYFRFLVRVVGKVPREDVLGELARLH